MSFKHLWHKRDLGLDREKVTLSGVVTKLESNIITLNSLKVLNHVMLAKLATLFGEFLTTITL